MELRKATRSKAKIRLGLSAVSGGGKTYSAILIAKGLTRGNLSKVAIIDTENGSADLYEHLGDYNVLQLKPPFSPERYIEAINTCENAGMEVIIIDSIAHEWEGEGGIIQLADSIGGGFQAAWKTLTPRHDRFKQAILQSKCHVITTVRRKQEYILQEGVNKNGKTVQMPVKAGMKEITREGWEYELTVNLELDIKHMASASKDRTGIFIDKDPFIPTEETGLKILEWCEKGVDKIKYDLIPDTDKWKDVVKRLSGSETINQIKEDFNLTEEAEELLKEDVMALIEWENDPRPELNLKQFNNAMTRITNGEADIYEKLDKSFKIKPNYKQKLQEALNGVAA